MNIANRQESIVIYTAQWIINAFSKARDAYQKIGFVATSTLILLGAGAAVAFCTMWPDLFYSQELKRLQDLELQHVKLLRTHAKIKSDLDDRTFSYNQLQHALTDQKGINRNNLSQYNSDKMNLQSKNESLRAENEALKKQLEAPTKQTVIARVARLSDEDKRKDLRYASEIYIDQRKPIFGNNVVISAAKAPEPPIFGEDGRCKIIVELATRDRKDTLEEIFETKESKNISIAGLQYWTTLLSRENGKCKFSYVPRILRP
jgi:hypothetical protein